MIRLGAGLYSGPTGDLLLNLNRAGAVRFSTNERGFADFACRVPLNPEEAYYLYDRPTLPHVAVTWAGGIVWEGRLEDVTLTPGGLELRALGYVRGYADAPYSASHIAVTAQSIVQALVAAVSGLNSFMSSSTMLVGDPGVTLAEIYEDRYPLDILDRLCNLGDTASPPNLWEAGVWEGRRLHFRARGAAARAWYVDDAAPEIERSLETLANSVYAIYQDGGNQRAVTDTSADAASVARFGLTRRAGVLIQANDQTLAEKVRDAHLADRKRPQARADLLFRNVADEFGTRWPAFVLRSGDTITLRKLPPIASSDLDRIRAFRIKETHYDADLGEMTVIPESLRPGLSPEANAERLASVTDPNLQYQPRPTLAELYADFLSGLGLRGLWYPGLVDQSGALYDMTGQGRTLTYNGNPTLNLHNGFIPYWDYDGTGDYHSRADEAGLEVSGTETVIASALRGLTVGGWFWADALSGDDALAGKDDVAASRAYQLYGRQTNSVARFGVSSDGSAVTEVAGATDSFATGAWHFVVGRFTPSTELALFADGVWALNTISIPANIYTLGSAAFTVAAQSGGSNALDGRGALTFLAATAWSDAFIEHLFERTRRFFGV